jgi:hypothetical protein
MCLGTSWMMIENGYAMNKTNLKVQVHQSWTFGLPATRHYLIGKAVTPSVVSLRSMSTWWKAYFISYLMDLVLPQDHVTNASKPLWQVDVVSAESCIVVVGLIFTLGTLAQVGACPKEMDNTSEMTKDILLLGHLLRRQARASKPSWRSNTCQVWVHLGLQEQSQTDSVFNYLHKDGKIIW